MNQFLQMGANTTLSSAKGSITISHEISTLVDVSLTAFLLTDADKVQGDSGIIFYNQPTSSSGVATLLPAEQAGNTKVYKLNFDMDKVPEGITKIAVTLTEDNSTGFANVKNLEAEICTQNTIIHLSPSSFTNENGIVVLELYLRNGQTKVKSIWQGFDSGLEGLCKNYGVEVEADEPSEHSKPQIIQEPVSKQPGSAMSINLEKVKGKINLDKGQKPVIIEKTPEITATVSWETGTDYDIYALVYTKDGKQIDVAMFGATGTPPSKIMVKGQLSIWAMWGEVKNQRRQRSSS